MADAPIRHYGIRRGRAIGIALFASIVTAFTAICSYQIISQAWQGPVTPATAPCRAGILELIRAVHRARGAASAATGGEKEALVEFRAALEPEWSTRPGLTISCAGDVDATSALADVDRLRYAEEHALRYEALDIAGRRQRVEAIERRFGDTH